MNGVLKMNEYDMLKELIETKIGSLTRDIAFLKHEVEKLKDELNKIVNVTFMTKFLWGILAFIGVSGGGVVIAYLVQKILK
jgi:hypothetical protein